MNTANIKINCLGASNTRIIRAADGTKIRDINYPVLLGLRLRAACPDAPCTVRNYGVSGTNITPVPGRADSYLERAAGMDGDADLIILQGEGNDASHGVPLGTPGDTSPDTFCGALRCLIALLRRDFPSARLLVLTAMRKGREPKRADGLTHADFHAAFIAVCRLCGTEPVDFCTDTVMNPADPAVMPDGVHMSERGCSYYADRLAGIIAGL